MILAPQSPVRHATMYQLPQVFEAEFPDRGKYAVADANGARLEPFACLYNNAEIPETMLESTMQWLERLRQQR